MLELPFLCKTTSANALSDFLRNIIRKIFALFQRIRHHVAGPLVPPLHHLQNNNLVELRNIFRVRKLPESLNATIELINPAKDRHQYGESRPLFQMFPSEYKVIFWFVVGV